MSNNISDIGMIEPEDFLEGEESPFRNVGVKYLGDVDTKVKLEIEEYINKISTKEPIMCYVATEDNMVKMKIINQVTDRYNRVGISPFDVVSGERTQLENIMESGMRTLTEIKYD